MKPIKKFMYAFFACSLFLVTGCKKEDKTEGDKFYYSYQGRPDITLTYKEVISMLQEYDETRSETLHAVNGTEDTRVNFIRIEDLKAYLAYVEKLSKDKDIKLTGINIISAAYPDNQKRYGEKRKYQTVILMPTTKVNGREDVSFEPLRSGVKKPMTFSDILKEYKYGEWKYDIQKKQNKASFFSFPFLDLFETEYDDTGLSSAANRMKPSPPN